MLVFSVDILLLLIKKKKKKKKSDLVVDESSIYLNLVVWILFLLVYSNLDRFLLTML